MSSVRIDPQELPKRPLLPGEDFSARYGIDPNLSPDYQQSLAAQETKNFDQKNYRTSLTNDFRAPNFQIDEDINEQEANTLFESKYDTTHSEKDFRAKVNFKPHEDPNTPDFIKKIKPAATPSKVSQKDIYNYACRWTENARFIGAPLQALTLKSSESKTDLNANDEVSNELEIGTLIGSGSGILIGLLLHFASKGYYKKNRSYNPLYRNFKTLASLGNSIGTFVAYSVFSALPSNAQKFIAAIVSDIASIVCGLFAIPYWLIRQYIFKIKPGDDDKYKQRYDLTGPESWSKYAKTALVYGTSLGQGIGFFIGNKGKEVIRMAINGAIGGMVLFVASIILVPIINRILPKILITNKERFRNNYVRSGIALFAGIGLIAGYLLATFLFPSISAVVGMTIGGAIGCVIGGPLGGIYGHKISRYTQKKWKVDVDTDNSVDYASRTGSILGAYPGAAIGLVVGFLLGGPATALIGASLGGAIGSVAGWFGGVGVIRRARQINPVEEKAKTLPWTQRTISGANTFALIGATLGLIGGLLGGPLGAFMGATLGYSIGGFLGSVIGALYDKSSRKMIFKSVPKIKHDTSLVLDPSMPVDKPEITANPVNNPTVAKLPELQLPEAITNRFESPTELNTSPSEERSPSTSFNSGLKQFYIPSPTVVVRENSDISPSTIEPSSSPSAIDSPDTHSPSPTGKIYSDSEKRTFTQFGRVNNNPSCRNEVNTLISDSLVQYQSAC